MMFVGITASLLLIMRHAQSDNCSWTLRCLSEVSNHIIHNLRWRRIAVIHDTENTAILEKLHQIEFMVYTMNQDTRLRSLLHVIHSEFFPDIHLVVALEHSAVLTNILSEADGFDVYSNHSTDWSHHSKWLVFTSEASILHSKSLELHNLQNVAAIIYKHGECACSFKSFTLQSYPGGYKFQQTNETVPYQLKMFPNTQYGYNGRSLRVSTQESPPFVIPMELKAHGVEDDIPYTGYCIEVLRTIAQHLNLTLEYVEPRDGIWGWIDDGMIGQLRKGELDLIASEMTVHVTRVPYIDYIMPVLQTDEIVMLYKMPPSADPIFLLTRPFQPSVYLTYLAMAGAVMLVLTVVEILSALTVSQQRRGVGYLCWGVIQSTLKQGDAFWHISLPGRCVLAFWLLVVVLISSLYCGQLTATLAASSPLRRFQTIDEVIDSGYTVGMAGGSIIEQKLKDSKRDDVKRLYQTSEMGTSLNRNVDYIQRVKEGTFAFVVYSLNVDTHKRSDCSLSHLVINDMSREPLTFAVQKHSPFKEDIDKVMQKLTSAGILRRMWERWNNQTTTKQCTGERRSIIIADLIGAVLVTSAGIALSLVSLILEYLIARCRK